MPPLQQGLFKVEFGSLMVNIKALRKYIYLGFISGLVLYFCVKAVSIFPLKPRSRIFLLGIDGLDSRVIDFLVAKGELPNIEDLIRKGAYGHLATDVGVSPVSWTSIATGKNKEKHGIKFYRPYSFQSIRVKRIWDIAEEYGKRVGVASWYFVAPTRKISSFMSPMIHLSPAGVDTTPYPSTLGKINDLAMENYERFINLVNDYNCDLVVSNWGSVDDAQHHYWPYFLLYIKLKDTEIANLNTFFQIKDYADKIFSTYKMHDRILGEFLRKINNDDYVIIVSDHGANLMNPVKKQLFFNEDFFTEFGIKKEDIKYADKSKEVSVSNKELDILITQKDEEVENPTVEGLTIPSILSYPQVKIILKTRMDLPGSLTLEKVKRVFNDIVWQDGRKIFSLDIEPEYRITAKVNEEIMDSMKHCIDRAVSVHHLNFTINTNYHSEPNPPDGVLIMEGPAIKRGYYIQGANLFDIVPTILYLMDLAVGRDMDGRVLQSGIKWYKTLFRPVRYVKSYEDSLKSTDVADTKRYKMRGEDRIRLKSLGYIQ